MHGLLDRRWHALGAEEVLRLLDTDAARGLDLLDVRERQEQFGSNTLPEHRERGPLARFLLQFHTPLIYVLLGAALVTAALEEWVDSGVILAVVLVNAIVGFIQEGRALRAIEALRSSLAVNATVIRAGEHMEIPAEELAPGDIVLLRSGDKVAADLRLIQSKDLQIDESALTGESTPVAKQVEATSADAPLGDRSSLAFSSTVVTFGTGRGVVVATGRQTQIGRISGMVSESEALSTPLTQAIGRFSRILVIVILALAAVTFVVGVLHGRAWTETFMAGVALAVGAIPEGLPAAVTIILAIGVSRMARRGAIIRRLPAVETLGSTTVICSDKTGTLTRNEMTVRRIACGDEIFEVEGVGYEPSGDFTREGRYTDPQEHPDLLECLRCAALCTDSIVVYKDDRWHVEGDPTEAALLVAASKAGLTREALERDLPRVDEIPFESQHQYMATLHQPEEGAAVVYLKGSIESILSRCERGLRGGAATEEFDPDATHALADELSRQGLRVLAMAKMEAPEGADAIGHHSVERGLTFLGLVGMEDPPREEARHAVRRCLEAGMQVKMITGDHPSTAMAIARQIGVVGDGVGSADEDGETLTGRQIELMEDGALIDRAESCAVFARVSPEHKLRIVRALQERRHVIAMTGDGVNDAPALKRADIGVAMGQGGTAAAREAADMILTDDNFATIEAAIEEGRAVFDNIIKFIVWTLPTNGGEALVILMAILLGAALPVEPVHILWINMTTAVCLGLMLAFEAKEKGIMRRPPRDPKSPMLAPWMIGRIIMVSALLCASAFIVFRWERGVGGSEAAAQTAAATLFVMGELAYLFACRSLRAPIWRIDPFSNMWIWIGVGTMTALQVAFVHTAVMNALFHTEPMSLGAWLRVLAFSSVILAAVELEKWIADRGVRAAAHRAAADEGRSGVG